MLASGTSCNGAEKALLAPPDNPLVLPLLAIGRGDMGKIRLARGRGTGISPVDVHVGARVRRAFLRGQQPGFKSLLAVVCLTPDADARRSLPLSRPSSQGGYADT